jgi:2-keto-4-pentenoate hydratase/2-oxohepta-3-ene-1,7-dioic acid hydratase in catechol pathway
MKLATYLEPGSSPRVGVVRDERVHPLDADLTMRQVVELGLDDALTLGEAANGSAGLPLDRVRLAPPLQPASIRDFVTFEEHVEGVRKSIDGVEGVVDAWYDAPTFYFTNPHTVLGSGDEVPFPSTSVARDFELEVAAVVGRRGRSLTTGEARQAIFGYTILNDWSARDLQSREMQVGLGPAKGKDFATTLGPWIVTRDEIDAYQDSDGFLDLWCSVTVNALEVGSDLLSNMGWNFDTIVAYASRDSWVVPGDVLGSGTTGNGGCLAELWGRSGSQTPPPLKEGDIVQVAVQAIGSIVNTVGSAAEPPALPEVRRRGPDEARARIARQRSYDGV